MAIHGVLYWLASRVDRYANGDVRTKTIATLAIVTIGYQTSLVESERNCN
jgi:hypothetical protein